MGLFDWVRRLLFGAPAPADAREAGSAPIETPPESARRIRRPWRPLVPLRASREQNEARRERRNSAAPQVRERPYRFARPHVLGGWLDLSQDGDDQLLEGQGLPVFQTPEQLAAWLQIPLGRLAWLVHRFELEHRPENDAKAHYHFSWLRKRSGGKRLIESPKRSLKEAQVRILREILDKIPVHPSAQGFVAGRSIRTNAAPHIGKRVVIKFDLENFYASVGFGRVVAILRAVGYCREAALWLARLTTSQLSWSAIKSMDADMRPYLRRHLPQGAPTSPALANLSAFSLDLRLAGLARTFGASYTRYADDLTFSGDQAFLDSLAVFIPFVERIIRAERFRANKKKRRVLRSNQRQQVAGVVVNARPNIRREEFDKLKAMLTNCIRRGPSTQNHLAHDDFASHIRGRIAHVAMLNPSRGAKLLALFEQIDWNR